MSTLALFGFYEKPHDLPTQHRALFYKHGDGYPTHVLPLIHATLDAFKARGPEWDPEYAAAWVMHDLMDKSLYRRFLGYGIHSKLGTAPWCEWFYHVSKREIQVYRCDERDWTTWKKTARILVSAPLTKAMAEQAEEVASAAVTMASAT